MENELKEPEKEGFKPLHQDSKLKHYYSIGKFILIILLVLLVGFIAVNQAMQFKYNAAFLATPCQLCKDLNENQSQCITGCFTYQVQTNQPQIDLSNLQHFKGDWSPNE